MDLLGTRRFGVENGLGVVEHYQHLRGGKQGSKWCQVLGIFDAGTDDLGQPGKEMGGRGRKLIATDESTVSAKSFFDPIVVEDGESDGCFPDSPSADESDWFEVFSKSDDLLNQPVPPKTVPWGRGRQFTDRNAVKSVRL